MKKKKNQNGSPNVANPMELQKADDEARRNFIKNCGYLMGILGVPYLPRVETLEKLSKRILGSSVAYAQSSGKLIYSLGIMARSGWHNFPCAAVAQDANTTTTAPDRNYYEGWDVVNANRIAAGVTGGNELFPSTPFKAVLDARPALIPRVVSVNMVNNGNGHTNAPLSTVNGSSTLSAFSYHQQKLGYSFTTGPIVFGNQSDADFSMIAGNVGPEHVAQYFDSVDGALSLVSAFSLSVNGTELSEATRDATLSVIAKANEPVIKVIEASKRDGAILRDGMDKLNTLLKTDLSAELQPQQVAIDAYTAGLNNPNNFSFGANIGEVLALFENSIQNNFSPGFEVVLRTGDWHGRPANQDAGANTGVGTLQADHNDEISQLIANIYDRLNTIPDPNNPGDNLADNLGIVIRTEFHRGRENPGMANNTDGDSNGFFAIAPVGHARGGNYGDRGAGPGGNRLPPDPNDPNGGTMTASLSATSVANTSLALMGVPRATRDEAGMQDGDNTISAIPLLND